jgi:hypothetical protein
MEPKPVSPKKTAVWIWVVLALVVVCLFSLVLIIGVGVFAAWKGYISLPAINVPAMKVPGIPTPQALPNAQPTRIVVEPYQPQPGDQYPTLQNMVPNWQNPTRPGTQTFNLPIPANQAVLLASGWCTSTQNLLNQNFQHIQYIIEVDGQPVDAKSLAQGTQQVSGQTCKDFTGIIRAWPSGKHTLKITMRVDAKINDGFNDYAAGDYVEIYNITVQS